MPGLVVSSCRSLAVLPLDAPNLASKLLTDTLGRGDAERNVSDMLGSNSEPLSDSRVCAPENCCVGKLWRCSLKSRLDFYAHDVGGRISMVGKNVKENNRSSVIAEAVAGRIKALRKSLGINQTELAEDLGVSQRTVSEWETGDHMPPPVCLVALGRFDYNNADWWYEQAGPRFAERLKRQRAVQEMRAEQRNRALAGEGSFWDPDLLRFVIEAIDSELEKRGKKLPSRKYAELIVLSYEHCQETGRRDSEIVGRLLKIA